MPQHLDRLTALDASFLHQEGANAHMHVGALLRFEGPPPARADVLEHLRRRLHLVPRYRHKLAHAPLDSGRPLWVDDPSFDLEYHLRHAALPAPGDRGLLHALTAQVFSQRLDRAKPLWELWLVEGLGDGGFALISKTHHALIDGISGVDLATVLLDGEAVPAPVAHSGRPWQPRPEPTPATLLGTGVRRAVRAGITLAAGAVAAAGHPERTLAGAREAAEGLGELVWAGLNPAPPTPLNVEIGPHRRFAGVDGRLADLTGVARAFGATVNDVVLAVVTGALRELLIARGVRTAGLELRALIPVSLRDADERGQLGNRLAALRGPLPVYIEDRAERLRFIARAMAELKGSRQRLGAEALAGVQDFAPPTLLAQASRLQFSTRLFNLIVTNVPGPRSPLYLLGRELRRAHPIGFLPARHALGVAVLSYAGQMNFGLLGDYDAVPDLEDLGEAIAAGLAELVALTG